MTKRRGRRSQPAYRFESVDVSTFETYEAFVDELWRVMQLTRMRDALLAVVEAKRLEMAA
ncbi:MAG TPA: hypothetical protein VF821_16915 [Lentzea sp.]